ncbi:hypothetical protein [Algibacter sp. Ld11]|uniref:hypothetical protein n=1 Tax=Algibacter sp. Ld11 TaxID=649150 RepID=UPI00386A1FBC
MDNVLSLFQENKHFLIPVFMFSTIILIGLLSYFFSKKNRMLREFKKTRKKSINSIKRNEYAKIIGKAKHVGEPLVAPLSGRKCVYYHVVVEVKGDKSWRKIINDVKSQDFFVATSSEMVMLKTSNLRADSKYIHLVKDFSKNSGFRNDAPEQLEAYLRKHSKKSTGLFGINKQMRYKEGVIELDENIAVKGIAEWKSLNEPIEGYSYSKILTLTGTKKQKLLVTDEPKALLRVNVL